MAALRRCLGILGRNYAIINKPRYITTYNPFKDTTTMKAKIIFGGLMIFSVGSSVKFVSSYKERRKKYLERFEADCAGKEEAPEPAKDAHRAAIQTARELRFLSFASLEYDGNIYMTPQDFLESVTDETPRARTGRRHLTPDDIKKYLANTPARYRGTPQLFRSLNDKGLISYTEYLFLLCVLTKPHSGFRIAFNMFDTDGNQRVDKKEFLVLIELVDEAFASRPTKTLRDDTDKVSYPPSRQSIRNIVQSFNLKRLGNQEVEGTIPDDGEERKAPTDTTLSIHFFGRRGNDVLKYEDFHRFMDNLQTEVLELEFNEFSKGMHTITEEEFAMVLLRFTILTENDTQDYMDRLRERVPHVKGITFEDFKDFGQFLNNLDDFSIAMRMYAFNGKPINEDEFKRAVKAVTGRVLNPHLVHVVFQLFDSDGDGHLSHQEFISVMKDRLHRGFKSQSGSQTHWETFKSCVKKDLKYGN